MNIEINKIYLSKLNKDLSFIITEIKQSLSVNYCYMVIYIISENRFRTYHLNINTFSNFHEEL